MEPGIEIEDLGARAKAMIRGEEDRSFWASHSNGLGYKSIKLPKVVQAKFANALFPNRRMHWHVSWIDESPQQVLQLIDAIEEHSGQVTGVFLHQIA
jgi:hypothetical protein